MRRPTPRLCLLALVLSAAGTACDSGEESPEATVAAAGPVVTSGSNTSTAGSGTTSTSGATTSGGGSGMGLIYQTGKGCTPGTMTETGQLQGPYEKLKFAVDGMQYFLQVNEWNSTATQTVSYGGSYFFKMTAQQGSAPTNGGPTGFPSLFIGGNGGNITEGSNLPKQVSNLTVVPTTWDWNDGGTLANASANSYNATYDVWFSVGADGEPNSYHPSGAFLMVWYHKPSDAQPIGSVREQLAEVQGVPGSWNVWLGDNGGTPVISYVATQTISYMDFDLNDFIKDAVARGGSVQNSHYLTNVFVGFEIWRGGVNLETTSFCAVVQ